MAEQGHGNEEQWTPKAEFYLSNPRSSEIRTVCGIAVQTLDRLLHDPSIATDPELRSTLYAQLEEANGKLISLGIKPEMHIGKPLKAFQSSSVVAAEFLASQLFPFFGRSIPSETDVKPVIEEFSEDQSGRMRLAENLPDKATDFMAIRGTVEFVKNNFDIKPQQDHQEPKN